MVMFVLGWIMAVGIGLSAGLATGNVSWGFVAFGFAFMLNQWGSEIVKAIKVR